MKIILNKLPYRSSNMRCIIPLILLFVSCGLGLNGQIPFITKWKTNNPGISDNFTVRFSVESQSVYDFEIAWGDGVIENYAGQGSELSVEHTYADTGVYTIEVSGTYPRSRFNESGDKFKIIEIVHWGDIEWQSFESAFRGCENLAMVADDVPDLSGVNDLSYMFWGVDSINPSISNWDVSTITNMENMFTAASSFNQPIGNWDVSNVTDMSCMFCANQLFNQPLNSWDVSNVVDMASLFGSAWSFNQPLDQWDVSSVTDMSGMFQGTQSFNQPIGNWNVSNVESMSQMFMNASAFNQPLDDWNISNVTTINNMFWNATAFNQPLNSWDVSSVDDNGFVNMFRNDVSFNQPLDQWDVSGINTMRNMFSGAVAFDQSLETWDVSSVTDFEGMLDNCGMNPCYYNSTLEGWYNAAPQTNMNLGAVGMEYTEEGEAFRQALINDFSWSITGDAQTVLPAFEVNYVLNGTEIAIVANGGSGTYTFLWTGPGGFSSEDTVITATENGLYTVVVSDGCELLEETIDVLTVGIEPVEGSSVAVFPNPVSRILNINLSHFTANAGVQIHNLSGQLLREVQLQSSENKVDVSWLHPGVYHCIIRNMDGERIEQFRFVKIN
ncbi:MAG: BspA family leucine-rich repeat surface protein [Cryomorphaceae bacterium]|nr:MAG: BspA family leucine-rich repeat surface protein [Cryomorphaceae bacterium]